MSKREELEVLLKRLLRVIKRDQNLLKQIKKELG